MRWDALFDDLEAQAAVLVQAERAAEVEERTPRGEGRAPSRWRDRGTGRARQRNSGCGSSAATGVRRAPLGRVGPDWLLLDEVRRAGKRWWPRRRIVSVRGPEPLLLSAVPGSAGVVESRIGLRPRATGPSPAIGRRCECCSSTVRRSTRPSIGSAPTSSRLRPTRPARADAGARCARSNCSRSHAITAVRRSA